MKTNLNLPYQDLARQMPALDAKPALYSPGTDNIWTEEHLSQGMLAAHLDDETDAASFRPARRAALLDFIARQLPLAQYPAVLDLGCGPGLYAQALAGAGRRVAGVDLSHRSIAHAKKAAEQAGLLIDYRQGDYLEAGLAQGGPYDLVMMISFDFGVLPPADRRRLLGKIHDALRPGGAFLLDVLTTHRGLSPEERRWEVGQGGYWSPDAYLLLNRIWHYEGQVSCTQHTLLDARGLRTFRVWEHLFTPQEIAAELEAAGFCVTSRASDPAGTPYQAGDPELYLVARRG